MTEAAHSISKFGVSRYERTAVKLRAGRYRSSWKVGMVVTKSKTWFSMEPTRPLPLAGTAVHDGKRCVETLLIDRDINPQAEMDVDC